MQILMVAAENDAIPGGKVGGIGDVVRDVPPALAATGHHVNVVTPSYGAFSKQSGAKLHSQITIQFWGSSQTVDVYTVPGTQQHKNVTYWVLEHSFFSQGGPGAIYCNDPSNRPFATDATKFALFSCAVAKAVLENTFGQVDVMHLHDWHAALVSVLRAFHPDYTKLKKIKTVYTIHNLALQGVRPFANDESSLQNWFPELEYDAEKIQDPRATNCINPMRAGINLCDKVHAVSPTYAEEILLPSNPEIGFFGGEGLETDLHKAKKEKRLYGILNGCEYPKQSSRSLSFKNLLLECENALLKWISKTEIVDSAHLIASRRLAQWMSEYKSLKRPFILTSVGRITDQKVLILRQKLANGESVLDKLLNRLGKEGVFILLGSGNNELEQFLTQAAGAHENFLYLKGYAAALPHGLYKSGDLFLMPSSFEPCGISQMLAMRSGQACLVHGVGGLVDTVNNENGFVFSGEGLHSQGENLLKSFDAALEMKLNKPEQWKNLSKAASKSRFLWSDVVEQYTRLLYQK